MSIKVITAVLELAPAVVTPPERLVLVALAWHADEHGRNAWPAVSTICRKTSLARRTVQTVLPRLKQKGLVYVQSVAARGSIRYGVDLAALDCARHAQSGCDDCAPDAQSGPDPAPTTAHQVHPTAHVVHPTAHHVHGGGAPRAPDPSFNRPLTVPEEEPGARSARRPGSSDPDQKDHKEGAVLVVANDPHRDAGALAAGAARRAAAPLAPPVNGPDAKKKAEADADTIAAYVAHDLFDTLGEDAPFPALAEAFTQRLNGHPGAAHILDNLGPFLYGVRKRRRQHARA